MKSIYLRNFVAIAAMVSICSLIIVFSFVGIGRNYIISEYKENMLSSAQEVSRMAAAVSQNEELSSWSLSMSVSSISSATGNHIFICNPDGVIVSCSDRAPLCTHMGFRLPDELMYQLGAGAGVDIISNLGGLYHNPRFVIAEPIMSMGKPIGYVFVTNLIDNMLGAWTDFLSIALLVTVGVFVAALLVSLVYTKRMARPLDEIAAASRKFARGDFSPRVRQVEDPTDEMGALIESFNKMADSLESAEKRRAEFIANVSHELRTPMTTISGFADGILDGTIPEKDCEKYLRSIRDETRRLSRLVRDMLDASQTANSAADPAKRSVFDLTELMLQTLLSFESRAMKKNLDVDPQFPDSHIMVRADRDAITRVIYNLLDNAVKFAKPDSCIVLRQYKDKGKAYVAVRNYGETIPEADLPYIFDRFHKSDRSRSLDKDGVGLGLYLVKTIINNHDEDIAVRSEDGWTEFVFTLPLSE